jgi:hypothetical protein
MFLGVRYKDTPQYSSVGVSLSFRKMAHEMAAEQPQMLGLEFTGRLHDIVARLDEHGHGRLLAL